MSDEQKVQTPFAPFAPAPPIVPEQPATSAQPEPRRTSRKKTTAKPAKKPRTVKAVNESPAAAPAPRQKRKTRTVPKVRLPRSLKLPVSTMLSALSDLRGDDSALFEKILGLLNGAAKGQRQRVLAALGKVFG